MRWIYSAFLMHLTLTLAGCATQNHFKQDEIRPLPYSTGRADIDDIDGLRKALALSPDTPVRVLVAHGMVTNKPEYSEIMQQRLAEKLALVQGVSSRSIDINRGYTFIPSIGPQPFEGRIPLSSSQIRKTTWVDPNNRNIERLVFYEMLWAPIRDEVKNRFLACFESRSVDNKFDCSPFTAAKKNTDTRALINGFLKDSVLVDGFADAIIVLGPIGDVLRDDTTLAMCMIARDIIGGKDFFLAQPLDTRCDLSTFVNDHAAAATEGRTLEGTKFFAITHSLGSFLVMDAQQRFAQTRAKKHKNDDIQLNKEEIDEALLFFLTDQSTVYMLANQIALLQLARFSPEGCRPHEEDKPCPNRLLRNRPDFPDMEEPLGHMTTYIAFNDVNDLLGFELPPYIADINFIGTKFVNVSVQNPGLKIPFLFKHPIDAHTRHMDNLAIINAIVEGIAVANSDK
ncbi:MAG: hypothetical protein ABIQ95_16925 [Bdellovibrionia bacterium]